MRELAVLVRFYVRWICCYSRLSNTFFCHSGIAHIAHMIREYEERNTLNDAPGNSRTKYVNSQEQN